MSFNSSFHTFHLPNGLRVLLRADPSWPVVSAHAWVRVGSLDEPESLAGVSHVLEHMVFKGTRSLPPAEISRRVEASGGSLNAETSREYTHYHIDVPREGGALAVQMLGEMLFRATISPREWAKECPVILEEMKRRFDDPETTVWESLMEALYRDSVHQRPVIGSLESVSALTAAQIRDFYQTHYVAPRTLVVLAGDFTESEGRRWIEGTFRSMPTGEAPPRRPLARMTAEARALRVQRTVKQAYSAWAVPGPVGDHQDQEALDLLAVILGEGRNARLVRKLYEEEKIVWSISATHFTQQTGGMFAVFADCEPSKRRRVDAAVRRELDRLHRHPPTRAELERAKNLVQTSWLQGFETFHSQAAIVGAYALDGQSKRLERYLPRLLALTRKDIQTVIERYFRRPWVSSVVEP